MWSPRAVRDGSATPASPPPVSTPADRSPECAASLASPKAGGRSGSGTPGGGGIFNSFSKMFYKAEGGEDGPAEHAGARSADPSAFITSSPRRSPAPPGLGGGGCVSSPLSVHVAADGAAPPEQTAMSPRTGSLLDSIFSPVFNSIFGQKGEKGADEGAAGGLGQPRETRDAVAQRAAAAAAALAAQHAAEARVAADAARALAAATAAAGAQAEEASEEGEEEEEGGKEGGRGARAEQQQHYELGEFDPYAFIGSLPPVPPSEGRALLLPRKPRGAPRLSLVLDLDETLLHSSIVPLAEYDIVFPVQFNGAAYQVYVRKRPHLDYFMAKVASLFEVIIFTASQRVYADRLLSIIDPGNKHIRHRLFRDSCVLVDGNYLKDLSVLNRELGETMIIDNSPQAFGFQLDNGIPIESWFDDPHDRELLKMVPFLETLLHTQDVRPAIRTKFELHKLVQGALKPGRR